MERPLTQPTMPARSDRHIGDTPTSTPAPAVVQSPFLRSLIAGAVAGTCTDLALFPLDTIKTRLQASTGFAAAGGFSGLYKGVGSAFVGAAPGAAAFFVGYDTTYRKLSAYFRQSSNRNSSQAITDDGGSSSSMSATTHLAVPLIAGSVGELAACTVRVPTEVCKQRTQTGQFPSSAAALRDILTNAPGRSHNSAGVAITRELYRGWAATVMREVPFSMIQFPIWEACKSFWLSRQRRQRLSSSSTSSSSSPPASSSTAPSAETKRDQISVLASAIAGVFSGSIAAAVTTPLDVIKTRMMLAKTRTSFLDVATQVYRSGNGGFAPFFAGVGPRVMWIGGGGFVFLGSYQWAINAMGGRGECHDDDDGQFE